MLDPIPQNFFSRNFYMADFRVFTYNTYLIIKYLMSIFSFFFSFLMLRITFGSVSVYCRYTSEFFQTVDFINIKEGFIYINCFSFDGNNTYPQKRSVSYTHLTLP